MLSNDKINELRIAAKNGGRFYFGDKAWPGVNEYCQTLFDPIIEKLERSFGEQIGILSGSSNFVFGLFDFGGGTKLSIDADHEVDHKNLFACNVVVVVYK